MTGYLEESRRVLADIEDEALDLDGHNTTQALLYGLLNAVVAIADRPVIHSDVRDVFHVVGGRVKTEQPTPNRFVLVDENGRGYDRTGVDIDIATQDDGRTIKVFIVALDDDEAQKAVEAHVKAASEAFAEAHPAEPMPRVVDRLGPNQRGTMWQDRLGQHWQWCGGTPGTWEWRVTANLVMPMRAANVCGPFTEVV